MTLKQFTKLYKENTDYKNLFKAVQISLFGDWLNFVAITDILLRLSDEASVIATIFIVHLLPFVFFTPIAGVLSDKISRLKIMRRSDIIRFVIVLLYLPCIYFGFVEAILVLLFIQYSFAAFFEPARSAAVPNIVEKKDLFVANAGLAAGWSLMMSFGMSVGGVLVFLSNPETALFFDAGTYLLSFYFIRKISVTEKHVCQTLQIKLKDLFRLDDYKKSFQYLKKYPSMIPVICSKGALEVTLGAFVFYLTLFGEKKFQVFGSTALSIGFLQAARGFGTGAGPIFSRKIFKTKLAEYNSLWICLLLIPIFYFIVSLQNSIWLALPFIFLAHLGGGANWVVSENLIHQIVPDQIRGRIVAFEFSLLTLMMSISVKTGAILIDYFNFLPSDASRYFVLIGIAVALFWLFLSRYFQKSFKQFIASEKNL